MKVEDEEKSKIGKNLLKDMFNKTKLENIEGPNAIADDKAKQ